MFDPETVLWMIVALCVQDAFMRQITAVMSLHSASLNNRVEAVTVVTLKCGDILSTAYTIEEIKRPLNPIVNPNHRLSLHLFVRT
jgi:hypothetical protein